MRRGYCGAGDASGGAGSGDGGGGSLFSMRKKERVASKPPAVAPQVPHHLLHMYNYDPPYNDFDYTYQYTSFPMSITLYNFNVKNTHLFFIITNNTISISPIYAAQNDNNNDDDGDDSGENFPLVHGDDEGVDNNNDNGVGDGHDLVLNDVDDNGNNGAGEDNDLVLNDVDDDNDQAKLVDDHDLVLNGGGGGGNDNGQAELSDVADSHYEYYAKFGPLRLIVFPDMSGLRHYGVRLTTLPTLPAYIHFDNFYYYKTTSLLINADTSVFVICPAPPLPVSPLDNAGNCNKDHTIYHAIALPLVLTLPFNIANTDTVINIFIRISPEGVKVYAATKVGVTDSVAYVTMAAPET
ncbi:unnamed protein product [Lupinus luteus]|uniref:Uncharacterized protein n=1 Tax=Lupinus luteus TaxID=3873 RepID=A0AAV1Y1I8_LUPLU